MGNLCSFSISPEPIFSQSFNCIARHTNYVLTSTQELDAMKTVLQELEALRNDVQRKVDVAEREVHIRRLDQVQLWLSKVDASILEGNILLESATNGNKCFSGRCPKNCWATYKLGRKIATKMKEVVSLKGKGSFDAVAERLASVPVPIRPNEQLVGFESALAKVWRCIEDEHVRIIGIYGMGGVGKTTLLTEILNAFASSPQSFDHVIWVSARRNQNLEMLQESIGKKIGFDGLEGARKSIDEKCEEICRLLNGKKYVLLLDNLWERIDLSKLGVPLPNYQNGSKIIFTTRSEIICARMDAQKKIKVDCLDHEKAWELFQRKVGEDVINCHPEIPGLAKIVMKECAGLPLALITIGRAMACKKTPQEWRHAITTLKKCASEFTGMDTEVLSTLKFSYDSLPGDTVKTCLLRIALHPENAPVNKRELIDDWFGEGFLRDHVDIDELQNHGYDIIGTLLSMCLLEVVAKDKQCVKMHDVIRDMVLWVAREYGQEKEKYVVEAGFGLTKLPAVGKWQRAKVVSVLQNNIEEITEEPSCPCLEALYLGDNSRLTIINPSFFQYAPMLRVLDLSHNSSLTKLPADICNLVALECLNLHFTGIKQLPFELRNLTKLKVLDLSFTPTMIPHQVISNLSALQVLKIWGGGCIAQSIDGVLMRGSESLIEEVGCLKHLIFADLSIKSIAALSKYLHFKHLMICIRILSIEDTRDLTSLDVSFLENARNLHELRICNCANLQVLSVKNNLQERRDASTSVSLHNSWMRHNPCFKKLIQLNVELCPILKDLNVLAFAPNLESLNIWCCVKMKKVIGLADNRMNEAIREETEAPFSKLKEAPSQYKQDR
ncbi:hypothetical protein Ancab_038684 [Ancistrocladus abbreviatus]